MIYGNSRTEYTQPKPCILIPSSNQYLWSALYALSTLIVMNQIKIPVFMELLFILDKPELLHLDLSK